MKTSAVYHQAQAIVKVRTSETLPAGATIGAIDATLTYSTNKGLSIAGSDVVASGRGDGALMIPNANNAAQVRLGLINVTPGIQSGEFATMTFSIADGNTSLESDFAIASGASVLDTNSTAITAMIVEIQGVQKALSCSTSALCEAKKR